MTNQIDDSTFTKRFSLFRISFQRLTNNTQTINVERKTFCQFIKTRIFDYHFSSKRKMIICVVNNLIRNELWSIYVVNNFSIFFFFFVFVAIDDDDYNFHFDWFEIEKIFAQKTTNTINEKKNVSIDWNLFNFHDEIIATKIVEIANVYQFERRFNILQIE